MTDDLRATVERLKARLSDAEFEGRSTRIVDTDDLATAIKALEELDTEGNINWVRAQRDTAEEMLREIKAGEMALSALVMMREKVATLQADLDAAIKERDTERETVATLVSASKAGCDAHIAQRKRLQSDLDAALARLREVEQMHAEMRAWLKIGIANTSSKGFRGMVKGAYQMALAKLDSLAPAPPTHEPETPRDRLVIGWDFGKGKSYSVYRCWCGDEFDDAWHNNMKAWSEKADAIAAILGRTCETCKFAGRTLNEEPEHRRFCFVGQTQNIVPLLTPSGEPHGCFSWAPKKA